MKKCHYCVKTLMLFVCLVLMGCSTMQRELNKVYTFDYGVKNLTQENIDKIVKGKTTKTEILTILSNPQMKQKSSLGEVWTYTRSITKRTAYGYVPDGSTTSSLFVTFDENGVVKDTNSFEMGSVMTGTLEVK